jgi:hypothetical protein
MLEATDFRALFLQEVRGKPKGRIGTPKFRHDLIVESCRRRPAGRREEAESQGWNSMTGSSNVLSAPKVLGTAKQLPT